MTSMKKDGGPDALLNRIVAFNKAKGGGVRIQKRSKGYSLFREDNGRAIARLRPTGSGDEVEVLWWSHRECWEQIGDFGPMVMSLDEALNYVARERWAFSSVRVANVQGLYSRRTRNRRKRVS
jgi:hypothetical protein